MDLITIGNESLRAGIHPFGAELRSLYHRRHRLEYIWQAGPAWPKHSPLLFPIVGELKNKRYLYNGHEYTLSRHGFARERLFTLQEQDLHKAVFRLCDDAESRNVFPFRFLLDTTYSLSEDVLTITYDIYNRDESDMYFSIGAHPAFRVPIDVRATREDHFIRFSSAEKSGRWKLQQGLLSGEAQAFLDGCDLPLTAELFEEDAIVMKDLQSDKVSLLSHRHGHGIEVDTRQAPYLGLWAAKGGDFVCIEPWQGIADSTASSGLLEEKEGILRLPAQASHSFEWSVKVF
jgi:galactose mutarotase-like enzyme